MDLQIRVKEKLHKTFSDIFFEMAKKWTYLYNNKDTYKDFISIKKFCEIIHAIDNKNGSYGVFNVSIRKKNLYDIKIINLVKLL